MWRRLKQLGYALLFLAFTAIGLGIAAFGEGADRLLGLGTVLFFGGGGAMYFVVMRHRGQPGRGPAVEHVTLDGRTQTAFVIRQDRRMILAVALGMLAMAVGGATFIIPPLVDPRGSADGGDPIIGLLAFGVLAAMGAYFLVKALAGSRIVLTRDGLWWIGPAGRMFVPWSSIGHVGIIEMYDSPMLALALTHAETVRIGRIQRLLMRTQRSMVGADLTFPLRSLAMDPLQFITAITRYVEEPELRTRIGTADELREIAAASTEAADAVEART